MIATIFDGTTTQTCTVQQAQAAANQPGISWIDLRIQDGDETDLAAMLTAVGVDPTIGERVRQAALHTDFSMTPKGVNGVCWIDDDGDGAPTQAWFTWDSMRLVTVRNDGDDAIAQVRERISDRSDLLSKDPSTLPGVVLQLMLATVQRGLTELMIEVGTLDMEILVTSTPKPDQSAALTALRQRFSALALRFPMYMVNVQAALIDPAPVAGLDASGMAQLQQFQSSGQATAGLIGNLAEAIKNATQDLQAQVAAFQGARINVLTIVTMIFLPISFLTGYFGMNFTWLDDQLDSYGVYMALGIGLPILLVVLAVVALGRSGYALPGALRRRKRPTST